MSKIMETNIEKEIERAKAMLEDPGLPEDKKNKAKLALMWLEAARNQPPDLILVQIPRF